MLEGAAALPCGPNPIRHLLLRFFCFDSPAVSHVFLSGGFVLAQVFLPAQGQCWLKSPSHLLVLLLRPSLVGSGPRLRGAC